MTKINPMSGEPKVRKLSKISKEEVHNLQLAIGMASVSVNDAMCELILLVQDGMKRYGGDFDLYTASRIRAHVERKYNTKKKKK